MIHFTVTEWDGSPTSFFFSNLFGERFTNNQRLRLTLEIFLCIADSYLTFIPTNIFRSTFFWLKSKHIIPSCNHNNRVGIALSAVFSSGALQSSQILTRNDHHQWGVRIRVPWRNQLDLVTLTSALGSELALALDIEILVLHHGNLVLSWLGTVATVYRPRLLYTLGTGCYHRLS